MAKLCLPDGAVRGIDIRGAQTGSITAYTAGRDGTVTVDNPQHERALRAYGAFPANLGGSARGGYRCVCGFGSFFATCSRCGETCQREP
ncbi:hypothetical protein JHN59_08640 [Streptomyces sp. MBT49]|uniref:hypothetical protein n=1 Tax=unclassified Streptomyces TaxID=2593676 RepID=UPI00190C99D1|nr:MULTISPECIES: hypothetical protein [unclassified Streptomyces]MBK3624914.1 hypothetical protein [Streptomyces sp. MBT49]MBK3632558.1 hypothetical protein [Streptomyces sp. MBT97]